MAKYRVMMAGDLHKRMKDITTIQGYCEACRKVQTDIIKVIRKLGVTHFISLGDWFDGGYGSDVSAALTHADIDRLMADRLEGNFYGLIGNHIRIRMDSNPELFLIQPHPVFTTRHPVSRREQIIKTPDRLVLNGTEIIFMHWNADADGAMDYKVPIDPEMKHHIALFHTDMIIPGSLLSGLNMGYDVDDDTTISEALSGVEIAIVGHIHKKIGAHNIVGPTGNSTLMIIPGSLTNVDSGEKNRHESIDIPIIDIDEDGSYTLHYFKQTLHLDMLKFMRKAELDDETKQKLKSLQGKNKDALYDDLQASSFIGDSSEFLTLNRFMLQNGYREEDKDMIRSVMKNPEDIQSLIAINNRREKSDV